MVVNRAILKPLCDTKPSSSVLIRVMINYTVICCAGDCSCRICEGTVVAVGLLASSVNLSFCFSSFFSSSSLLSRSICSFDRLTRFFTSLGSFESLFAAFAAPLPPRPVPPPRLPLPPPRPRFGVLSVLVIVRTYVEKALEIVRTAQPWPPRLQVLGDQNTRRSRPCLQLLALPKPAPCRR